MKLTDKTGTPILVDEETGEVLAIAFKTPYNHDVLEEARRTALTCNDPSLAQQSARDETDINTIVSRFLSTGTLPEITLPPQFGDFTNVENDYLTAQRRIAETNATFYQLDAHIRAEFANDPARWQRQVMHHLDNGNRAELRAMGLNIPDPPNPGPTDGITNPTGVTPQPAASEAAKTAPKGP